MANSQLTVVPDVPSIVKAVERASSPQWGALSKIVVSEQGIFVIHLHGVFYFFSCVVSDASVRRYAFKVFIYFAIGSYLGTAGNFAGQCVGATGSYGLLHGARELEWGALCFSHSTGRRFVFFTRFVRARGNSSVLRFVVVLRGFLGNSHRVVIFFSSGFQFGRSEK